MKFFSGEKLKGEKTPNPLKAEHLKEGVSPIIACIGTPKQFRGVEKETGESVSFLSHEDPDYFLRDTKATEKFANDLREQLEAIKKRCEEGTVDAVIVGGNYFSDRPRYQRAYKESIELLSKEVQEVLGFEPVAITGLKTMSGQDDVFYDNGYRRLYIMRPEVGKESTKSYLPSDVESQESEWDKETYRY